MSTHATIDSKVDALAQLIISHRHILRGGWIGASELRERFLSSLTSQSISLTPKELNNAWSEVMKRDQTPDLLAIQQVYRSSGHGQVSVFLGDAFQLSADQWICSAFQDDISPSGGAWHGFWEAAGRAGQAWTSYAQAPFTYAAHDKQIALLEVNPKKRGGLPTLVLFGYKSWRFLNAQRSAELNSSADWVEAIYFDALRLCRQLNREKRLGRRVACPLLFSGLHGVSFSEAISLQRSFALDLLRQEPSIQEVLISVFERARAEELLAAWRLASGDQHITEVAHFPNWIKLGVETLSQDLKALCLQRPDLDPQLLGSLSALLKRLESSSLFLNDLAVLARNIVEKWAQLCCQRAGLKRGQSLGAMVSQLRGRSGSPNRSVQYLDAIRELGNVGAHFQVAPHQLEPADLITLLNGLIAMIRLDSELG